MIFATVRYQLPFDRMMIAVDAWCERNNKNKAFAQIGLGGLAPQVMNFERQLSSSQYEKIIATCKVVICEPYRRDVMAALHANKHLVVMPRRAAIAEYKDDSQVAAAERLSTLPGINFALDAFEVFARLDRLLGPDGYLAEKRTAVDPAVLSAAQSCALNDEHIA